MSERKEQTRGLFSARGQETLYAGADGVNARGGHDTIAAYGYTLRRRNETGDRSDARIAREDDK